MMHSSEMPKRIEALHQAAFERLNEVSRTRRLTSTEERRLYEAIRHLEGFGQRRWTSGEIGRLKRYLLRGKKPANIAPMLGRTERAVWRMIYRQGWVVRGMAPPEEKPEPKPAAPKQPKPDDGLVKVGEAAKMLGITTSELGTLLRRARGPAIFKESAGGHRWFRREDVEEFAARFTPAQIRFSQRRRRFRWMGGK